MATRRKSRKRRNPSNRLPAYGMGDYLREAKRFGVTFPAEGFVAGYRTLSHPYVYDIQIEVPGSLYKIGDIIPIKEDSLIRNWKFVRTIPGLVRPNPSDLAVREKFDRCVASVRAKSGKRHLTKAGRYARISSPEAVCAKSIRRTSRKQLAKISAEGRSLAAARRHARGYVRSRKTGRLVRRPMSRIHETMVERRGFVGRVMRQQKIAKLRAKRQMARRRNPDVSVAQVQRVVESYLSKQWHAGRLSRSDETRIPILRNTNGFSRAFAAVLNDPRASKNILHNDVRMSFGYGTIHQRLAKYRSPEDRFIVSMINDLTNRLWKLR